DSLVHVTDGRIDGVLVGGGYAFEVRYLAGFETNAAHKTKPAWGYVVMNQGIQETIVGGQPRILQGWIGIGDGPDEIPFEHVRTNAKPANGKDGKTGWIIEDRTDSRNPRGLGMIFFGVEAE